MTDAVVAPALEVPGTTMADGAKQLLQLLTRPDVLKQMQARTGLNLFDRFVAPRRGQLIVLGAENGSGKSTLLLTLLLSAACRGDRVALFSIEDVAILLRARLLGLLARVNPSRILDAELGREDYSALTGAVARAPNLPLTFFEGESDVETMLAKMEQLAAADTRFVAIDYLQQIGGLAAQDRRNEIRMVTQRLALFARKHHMCLILVSQVVRPQSRSVGTEPNRHWLKEAGDIADAADKIVLLWRSQDGGCSPTNVKLDKDKDGRHVGRKWLLHFNPKTGCLREGEVDGC